MSGLGGTRICLKITFCCSVATNGLMVFFWNFSLPVNKHGLLLPLSAQKSRIYIFNFSQKLLWDKLRTLVGNKIYLNGRFNRNSFFALLALEKDFPKKTIRRQKRLLFP